MTTETSMILTENNNLVIRITLVVVRRYDIDNHSLLMLGKVRTYYIHTSYIRLDTCPPHHHRHIDMSQCFTSIVHVPGSENPTSLKFPGTKVNYI